MPGDHSRDVTARLTELEATVRGLTQELVSANERIRALEAAVEDAPAASDGAAGSPPDDEATKTTPVESQAASEATSGDDETTEPGTDPDDIIVA